MSGGLAVILAIVAPLVGGLFVLALGKRPNLRETASLLTAGALFAIVLTLFQPVMAGERPGIVLAEPLPGLPLALEVEPLGLLFALVASSLWIVTSLYSIGYMRGHHEKNQTRFYFFFAVALSSAMGVAFAGNLFTLFVFYEVLTLCTFPLVTHHQTPAAKKAGRVYLGILLTTSIGLQLLAIVWTYFLAGTLDFEAGGILANQGVSNAAAAGLLALYVFGIGKAAVMPFHRWLPAAMVAPTPVSALLHAVAVVKAGVFSVLKVCVYVFGWEFITETGASDLIIWVVAATIILASLRAFTKDNLKARLAYSTISQLSYIVLGALLANEWGIIGGGMHIAMHAFGKITLFFGAGAIMVAAHKTDVSQMKGLGRTMPITFGAFLVGSLSIIGLPPAGGAWSKWFLGLGALEAGQLGLLGVLMLSSLLSLVYLLEIPVKAFFLPSDDPSPPSGIKEAPLPSVIALVITASVSLGLFFFPGVLYDLMSKVVGL
ncbi:MAG: monovalent cation/H+ antiporter subunit D family protein [Gemmatimonadetes bacterium]|nr:monovalent cation/H+ antiporter subunit D family protein [Gemmatimonadota bacterium]